MVTFDEVKRDLPNFPDEVIEIWLLPFAQTKGWPPGDLWGAILDYKDLNYLKKLKWEKTSVSIQDIKLTQLTIRGIKQMRVAYLDEEKNIMWDNLGEDGKKRYKNALSYIAQNGVFPKPIILQKNPDGAHDILDGNHRFLSYLVSDKLYNDFEKLSDTEKAENNSQMFEKCGFMLCKPLEFQNVWICDFKE